jgi:predicted dehydrogenase/threonine dehydrogenase-like Zn-dependent dehydrogenase
VEIPEEDEDFIVKQVLRCGIKEIIVDEVPAPALAPHQVLIRPSYSLISSGTESASIHSEGAIKTVADHPEHLAKIWKALKEHGPIRTLAELRAKFQEYSVLGYAGAGRVVGKHATVTDLEPGDRVAYGGEGTGHGEYIVAARNYVAKVPESVPFAAACFTTLGSIALNASRTAKIALGDVVVVEGLGLVGQLITQLGRLQGGIVIGTDLREDRIELARRLGAHHAAKADGSAAQVVNAVSDGRGADCVIIAAASKSSAPARQALALCREGGRIIVVGAVDLHFPWEEMYLKEIRLAMARAYGPGCYDPLYERGGRDYSIAHVRWTANRNMEVFLRMIASGQVQLNPLISHEFPLEEAARAYETVMDPASSSLAVVMRYPEAEQTSTTGDDVPKPLRKVEICPSRDNRHARRARVGELNAALVGAGNLARWVHLPVLKRMSGTNVRAVFSNSGVRGKNYSLRFGATYCTSDYEEILNDAAIDVVVIASRNAEHCPQALAALRAGKDVFVEKPMAITESECRLLCEEVNRTGRQFTVGFNRRFAPVYAEMKKQLKRRAGPAVINCRVNSPGISGGYWMADPETGGAVVGEGCHFVDLMYWLLESEPVSVTAYSLPRGKKNIVGENNVVASLRFEDGSIGNLTYCTVGSLSGGGERVEAFAPGIRVSSEDFKHLSVAAETRTQKRSWFPKKGHATQMQGFMESIRNGNPPEVQVQDGARATLCCLRILESASTLQPCSIDMSSLFLDQAPETYSAVI